MSEEKSKGARVEALKYHTFRGKAYQAGDRYTVQGDDQFTADDVVDSLRGSGLAKPVGEESALVIEEVGQHEDEKPAAKDTSVAPMTKEDLPKKSVSVKEAVKADHKPASAGKK